MSSEKSPTPSSLRALVVEDDDGTRHLVLRHLQRAGVRGEGAENGHQALGRIAELPPDLLILDYMLPDMNATALLDQLPFPSRIPFVVMTGQGSERVAAAMMRRGARDYLVKDATFTERLPEVLARVSHQLETDAKLRRAVEALRTSEDRHRRLVENLGSSVFLYERELDGRLRYVSPSAESVLSIPVAQLVGRSVDDLFERRDGSGQRARRFDTLARAGDGSLRALEVVEEAIGGLGDDADYVEGVVHDLTARIESERDLRLRSAALEAAVNGIAITDAGGGLAWVNPAFSRLTGLDRGARDENGVQALLGQLEETEGGTALRRAVKVRQPWAGHLRLRGNGELRPIEASITPFEGAGVGDQPTEHLIWVLRDRSRESELETHLRRAQRLEALGRLAGGLAHDFNNLLAVILGFADLVIAEVPEGSEAAEALGEIAEAAKQGGHLTRDLLAFGRREAVQPTSVYLDELVTRLDPFIRRTLGENIRFDARLAPCTGPVWADPGQLELAIMNLVTNARDAMPRGGDLTITCRPAEPPAGSSEGGERWAELSVADTGCGIAEDVIEHMFEPFYNVAGRSDSSGLSLASVYGAVNQIRGEIQVENRSGAGCRFRILLPVTPEEGAATVEQEPAPRRGGGRILLVEDEPMVLKVTKALLERGGHEVVTASSGDVALELIEEAAAAGNGRQVSVLVSDVVMPGMSGPALGNRVAADHPEIPILFVTGYADEMVNRHGPLPAGSRVLRKPFRAEDLLRALAEILDTSPQSEGDDASNQRQETTGRRG